MQDIEIEIQVKVEKSKPLINFLRKSGRFIAEEKQNDEYFVPPHRDFANTRPIEEWLRVRETSGKQSINYKRWHYDNEGRGTHADEYETTVTDAGAAKKIFGALNFRPQVTVNKTRRIWMYHDYEISIDSVGGLGDFVEIEYKGRATAANAQKINAEMIWFLKERRCGKIWINYQGYPFLRLFPEEADYREV